MMEIELPNNIEKKWREGFRAGFLAATDAVKRGYSEGDLQTFADRDLKEWLDHPTVRKWPPRIFGTIAKPAAQSSI